MMKIVRLNFLDVRYIWDSLQEVIFHLWMGSKSVTLSAVGVVASVGA